VAEIYQKDTTYRANITEFYIENPYEGPFLTKSYPLYNYTFSVPLFPSWVTQTGNSLYLVNKEQNKLLSYQPGKPAVGVLDYEFNIARQDSTSIQMIFAVTEALNNDYVMLFNIDRNHQIALIFNPKSSFIELEPQEMQDYNLFVNKVKYELTAQSISKQ
jgi:hypothetical protein